MKAVEVLMTSNLEDGRRALPDGHKALSRKWHRFQGSLP